MRVAHEDGGLDGGERITGERLPCTAAEGVVHDLAALYSISVSDRRPSNKEPLRYLLRDYLSSVGSSLGHHSLCVSLGYEC